MAPNEFLQSGIQTFKRFMKYPGLLISDSAFSLVGLGSTCRIRNMHPSGSTLRPPSKGFLGITLSAGSWSLPPAGGPENQRFPENGPTEVSLSVGALLRQGATFFRLRLGADQVEPGPKSRRQSVSRLARHRSRRLTAPLPSSGKLAAGIVSHPSALNPIGRPASLTGQGGMGHRSIAPAQLAVVVATRPLLQSQRMDGRFLKRTLQIDIPVLAIARSFLLAVARRRLSTQRQ
jgi:hypothetical protein